MHRRFFLALTCCAAVPAGSARAQPSSWQTIAGPNGRYSVEMPTPVRHQTSSTPAGGTLRQTFFSWDGGGLDFAVYDMIQSGADHPPTDLQSVLANSQRAVQGRWPGSTVMQQGAVQSGPAQGRAFTLSINGGKGVLTGRVYYNDWRLYEMLALTRPGEQNGEVVTRFMDSLRITS